MVAVATGLAAYGYFSYIGDREYIFDMMTDAAVVGSAVFIGGVGMSCACCPGTNGTYADIVSCLIKGPVDVFVETLTQILNDITTTLVPALLNFLTTTIADILPALIKIAVELVNVAVQAYIQILKATWEGIAEIIKSIFHV